MQRNVCLTYNKRKEFIKRVYLKIICNIFVKTMHFKISVIFKNVPSRVIVYPTFIPSVGVNRISSICLFPRFICDVPISVLSFVIHQYRLDRCVLSCFVYKEAATLMFVVFHIRNATLHAPQTRL